MEVHRKRKKSTGDSNYVPPCKKNRYRRVLPSKFLLGGNIRDPLNLGSLADAKVNEAVNAETPKSSPMPVPPHRHGEVPVFIPKNLDDPLGLQCAGDADEPQDFIAGIRKRFHDKSDPIVSPVVPQPGCGRRYNHHYNHHHNNNSYHHHYSYHGHHHHYHGGGGGGGGGGGQQKPGIHVQIMEGSAAAVAGTQQQLQSEPESSRVVGMDEANLTNSNNRQQQQQQHSGGGAGGGGSGPKFRKKDELFQYGNYNRYYGYRSQDTGYDLRLKAFPKGFFQGKDVLDVGCNIGHVTLLIARDFEARKVVGIDIDARLVDIAGKNVKHYLNSEYHDPDNPRIVFPRCMPKMYGPLNEPRGLPGDTRKIPFPYNVTFEQADYVLESEEMLKDVKQEFDIILCLSITKWVHLNNGDDGLKRFFRRAFLNLRPGGKLVLEPQPWSSYKRKKRLTEKIFKCYQQIRFLPDQFPDFLLKDVGFSTMERFATPTHNSKGFQRPLIIFTKANNDQPVC